MISIVDYGAGNTANVKNALDKLGARSVVTRDQKIWNDSDGIILRYGCDEQIGELKPKLI